MTLGGLALAVGILVDDATVEIKISTATLKKAKRWSRRSSTVLPRSPFRPSYRPYRSASFFVPMFFMGGVAKYLFVPLAEAVIFAMLASYFLSRTVVPTHGQVPSARA